MARIIAIANQKGGVAKTTTTINLAAGLAREGKRVLAIDLDPQAHTTKGFGWRNTSLLPRTLCEVMRSYIAGHDPAVQDAILHHTEGVDVLPNRITSAKLEKELDHAYSRETVLLKCINPMVSHYDYIVIDCPPYLGNLPTNALVAANSVVIPCAPEDFSTDGLGMFFETIIDVKRNINFSLEIDGILITRVDYRNKSDKEFAAMIRQTYSTDGGIYVFQHEIPQRAKLKESSSSGQSVFAYDPKGDETEAYRGFVKEVINNGIKFTRGAVSETTSRISHI